MAKTKEVIFRINQELSAVSVSLDGPYLGIVPDREMNFSENTDCVFKKCSQRLGLFRRRNSLGVSQQILLSLCGLVT